MSQKRGSDKNSVSGAVEGFSGAMVTVELPAGVELRSDDEFVIWEQFTRARAREDWRDMDLILLAKVVKMEADIRKYQQALDQETIVIENKRGTPIVNPLLSVIDGLERRQLAVIRSMSLNQQAADPRTINGRGKSVGDKKSVIEALTDSGLIALPNESEG